jgi:hypothetical protein
MGAPAIVMRDGQVQRQTEEGTVDVLDFDRYVLQMDGGFEEPEFFFLKASDRTLYESILPGPHVPLRPTQRRSLPSRSAWRAFRRRC